MEYIIPLDIIVAKDQRLPFDISPNYKFITKEEFIKSANQGMDIDENLYINLDILDEAIYDGIIQAKGVNEINVIFYQFEDQNINLPYIKENIKVYKL